MFKVGDKVRCIRSDKVNGAELNKTYTVTGYNYYNNLLIEGVTHTGFNPNRFELVEENNVNPYIKTEEIKVVKTKVVSGRLDQVLRLEAENMQKNVRLHGTGSMYYNGRQLRELARQLDEIANVLEPSDNGAP